MLTMNASGPARREPIIVPPRVHIAMQMLAMLNNKTEPVVVVAGGFGESGGTPERIDTQKLTVNEVVLHDQACETLIAYLAGKHAPDELEKPAMRREAKRAKKQEKQTVRMIACPNCHGAGGQCSLCLGESLMALVRPKDV